jgi:co-chaperonin GroES (HSP10)
MSETKKEMKIYPSKRVAVIRQADLPNSSHIIPVTSNAPQIGVIVAMGESKNLVRFKVGDYVAYRQYGEYEIFINGETLYFVRFADILGVISSDKNCCKD